MILGTVARDASAQSTNPAANPALDWLRDYLEEFSTVLFSFPGGGTREIVRTRTAGLHSADAFALSYERITYAKGDPSQVEQRQLILYDVKPAALDQSSIAIRKEGDIAPGQQPMFWMVSVSVNDPPGHIAYDNLFEARAENGEPELTRSRGRVREVVLGYFMNEDTAKQLAEKFRAYLGSLPAAKTTPAAPVTRPNQSDA